MIAFIHAWRIRRAAKVLGNAARRQGRQDIRETTTAMRKHLKLPLGDGGSAG